jgi:cysteine desulfurase/selenocysteine lyase
MPETPPPSWNVDRVRRDFPILERPLADGRPLVYLDTAASAQKPRAVIEKIRACYEEFYANVHRGIHELGDRMTTELEAAREKVRALLNARQSEEVVFTSGTTMSINLVACGWGRKFLKPGDEILLNEMEHHANLVPWQRAAEATGAVLRYLPLTEDGRLDLAKLDERLSTSWPGGRTTSAA